MSALDQVAVAHSKSSRFVYVAAAFAALGGLLFGYDTGVISGAVIFIKREFGLTTFPQELVVSVVLVGAAIAALGGGKLSDRFGRRRTLIATSILFIVGSLLSAVAPSMTTLVFARLIVGLGIGLSSITVPVYISEVSPAGARGWLVSLFQLAITVGILAAYVVDYLLTHGGAWRWMLGLGVIPGATLGLGMIYLPESPRWLAKRGRLEHSLAVLQRIRMNDAEAELEEILQSSKVEMPGRWRELLGPAVRPALVIGIGLAIFQQITGINTVIYYAPAIILSAGIPSAAGAILATAGIGVVNVLMTLVSMRLIDRAGRRPLLLYGTTGMAVCLCILGSAFRFSHAGSALAWVAVITLMLYVASFAISLGPVFWLLIAEIYPLNVRGIAEGTAAATNWAANLLVSITFLSLLEALGPSKTFWLYGVLAIASWFFSYYLVPETRGKTLEQIERSWERA
jgi:sugar porter (SP) family MFS transporter